MTFPLVGPADPDIAAWQSGDQDTFLAMACAEVQKFCGWHIAPSYTFTDKQCWIGARGLTMLGSAYVTAVSSVTMSGQTLVSGTDYDWQEPKGWLRLHPQSVPAQPYNTTAPNVLVTFNSGYNECPPDVKAVIFEVMSTAMELPASNASEVMTMQYRFNLRPDMGVALSPQQKVRLGRYVVRNFGGLTRP